MRGFIKRFCGMLRQAFGIDYLNRNFIHFAVMHTVYSAATACTTTYVNTLIMRVSEDANAPLYYNIIMYIFGAGCMLIGASLIHKIGTKYTMATAMTFSMLTFIVALVFIEQMGFMFIAVAALHGAATGIYWIVYFNYLLNFSTDDNRDLSLNFIGLFSGLVSIVIPLVSGAVIGALAGFLGYYIVFGVYILGIIVSIFIAFSLAEEKADMKKMQFKKLLKKIYSSKMWFCCFHMDLCRGLRDGAFAFFLNILIFKIVENEAIIGVNTFIVGIVSMISCMVAGKITKPGNRLRLMGFGITFVLIFVLLMMFNMNLVTVLLLASVNAFCNVFISNPATTTLYTVFDRVPHAVELKHECISVTECYKGVGRISGIILIMLMPEGIMWSAVALLILVALQLVGMLCGKITLSEIKKQEI